jgi:hypothetical protein
MEAPLLLDESVPFVKSASKLLSLDGPLAGRCAEDAGARALYCSLIGFYCYSTDLNSQAN